MKLMLGKPDESVIPLAEEAGGVWKPSPTLAADIAKFLQDADPEEIRAVGRGPCGHMSDIDRQRISGVKLLEGLGYAFRGGEWHAPAAASEAFLAEADAMHALLVTGLAPWKARSRTRRRRPNSSPSRRPLRPTRPSVGRGPRSKG